MPKGLGERLDNEGYFSNLRQEVLLFEETLDCSNIMQRALLGHDIEKLEEATMQNETFIHRINLLERERLQMYPGTISLLIKNLSSPFSELLGDIEKHWSRLIKELDTIKYQNAKLLISAIETNKSMLQKLVTLEAQNTRYEPNWLRNQHESRELFLNQKV